MKLARIISFVLFFVPFAIAAASPAETSLDCVALANASYAANKALASDPSKLDEAQSAASLLAKCQSKLMIERSIVPISYPVCPPPPSDGGIFNPAKPWESTDTTDWKRVGAPKLNRVYCESTNGMKCYCTADGADCVPASAIATTKGVPLK